MDPSDILRRIEAQTQFNYLLDNLTLTQPGANISTLRADGAAKINYISYAQRQSLALGKFYVEGGSTVGFGFIPNTFAPKLTIIIPSTFRQTFTYTGSLITYTLPDSRTAISSVRVFLWGAGGGDGGGNRGGSGAFVSGDVDTTSLLTLYVVVGGVAGGRNIATGGGGTGQRTTTQKGNGGGFSGIFNSSSLNQGTLLCCAAGGGGEAIGGSAGGAGGLATGGNATSGGTGGTQSAGGTSGGAALLGGDATGGDGAAGGGGYYGGGGAGGGASGGGGSSYTTLLTNFSGEAGKTGAFPGVTPGGTTNSNYVAPYGSASNAGYVVITGTRFIQIQ